MNKKKSNKQAVSPMASGPDGEVGEFDDALIAFLADALRRQPKKAVSIRLDPFVLQFFKTFGNGYQTRMSAVLRAYALRYERQDDPMPPSNRRINK